jgi:hypothetical protein
MGKFAVAYASTQCDNFQRIIQNNLSLLQDVPPVGAADAADCDVSAPLVADKWNKTLAHFASVRSLVLPSFSFPNYCIT